MYNPLAEKEHIEHKLELIQGKLGQLKAAYKAIKSSTSANSNLETIKEGFLVKAGKTTESVLKFICINENITPATKSRSGVVEQRPVMLNDLIQTLKEKNVVDEDILHHLHNIKSWRNKNAHDNSSDWNPHGEIAISTIDTVNDSFNYFIEWFFKVYLKDEIPDFSNSETPVVEKSAEPELAPEPAEETQVLKPPFPQKRTKKKSAVRRILLVAIVLASAIAGTYFIRGYYLEEENVVRVSNKSREDVYNLVEGFLAVCSSDTFDARAYLADTVTKYYRLSNLTPEEIKHEPSKKDFQVPHSVLDKSSFRIRDSSGTIMYWEFWNDFTCFRPSHSRYQRSKVLMEFGINEEFKITSIVELKVNRIY